VAIRFDRIPRAAPETPKFERDPQVVVDLPDQLDVSYRHLGAFGAFKGHRARLAVVCEPECECAVFLAPRTRAVIFAGESNGTVRHGGSTYL
jgi:hypothetical protein